MSKNQRKILVKKNKLKKPWLKMEMKKMLLHNKAKKKKLKRAKKMTSLKREMTMKLSQKKKMKMRMRMKKMLHHLIFPKSMNLTVNAQLFQPNQAGLLKEMEDIQAVETTEAEEEEERMLENILPLTNASRSVTKQAQKSVTTSSTVEKELVITADFGQEHAK